MTDGLDCSIERVELAVEKPGDATGLNHYIGMKSKTELLRPLGHGDTGKVTYGNLQVWKGCDNLIYLGNIGCSLGKVEREDDSLLLHIGIHAHQLGTVEWFANAIEIHAVSRDLYATETFVDKPFRLLKETITTEVTHAAYKESVGVSVLYIEEVVVLYAVDELLSNN